MKPITNHLISKTVAVLIALASFDAQCGTLGVYTSDQKGFDTHTFWYDDGKEVTLIDTQFVPQLTEAMVQQVKSSTASPITRVIVTHANPDKYNGLAYLHKLGVESITSAAVSREMPVVHAYKENYWVNVAKMFKPGTYPAFENVKKTFIGQTTISLQSGETLSLFELKSRRDQ
ncbi:hypothetical protein ACFQAT_21100 [Undibacterium arcticum]|uniref:hypothetical protein n=1 Tax=Undibacterium arcticum TaxID=1762892 RepID=UPI00360F3452